MATRNLIDKQNQDERSSGPGISAWIAYDFINSLLIINGSLYFSAWLTQDQHVNSFWYGFTYAASTLLLLLILPIKGAIIDRYQNGRQLLCVMSIVMACAAFILPALGSSKTSWRIAATLAVFGLINFAYQASLVAYNWLLVHLIGVESAHDVRRVSGLGEGAGSLGSVIGALLGAGLVGVLSWGVTNSADGHHVLTGVLLTTLKTWSHDSLHVRLDIFLPLSLIFLVLFLIDYRFLGKGVQLKPVNSNHSGGSIKELIYGGFAMLRAPGRVRTFLIAFMLYADALLTVQLYIPIFMRERIGLGDTGVAIAFVVSLAAGSIGAWLFAIRGRNLQLRNVILMCLAGWSITLILFGFAKGYFFFFTLMIIAGLLYGALWSASRAYLIELIPLERLGRGFGFYSVFERCASILGPLLWGMIMLMPWELSNRYMCAFALMSLLVVLGGLVLWFSESRRVV
jgi:UMF1 family MFS transporter